MTKIDIAPNDDPLLCDGSSCYDQVLVNKLSAKLKQDVENQTSSGKNSLNNQMIALHTMGSHGPTYWKRYPENMQRFSPACSRSDIENCTDEEIVNVYDNTLAYTDYILAETIKVLQQYQDKYNVSLVYLSDHGESLGENGMYLHGTPYAFAPKEQTHIPWFMWLPQDYTQAKGMDRQCLVNLAQTGTFSHDNLFHSLLGLYGVATSVHDPKLDITTACKTN